MKHADLTGKQFGWLRVVSISHIKRGNGWSHAMWNCECECGNKKTLYASNLISGGTKSCGCKKLSLFRSAVATHGESHNTATPEFIAWGSMKARCTCKTSKHYTDYGGRGITVCDRWLHSFENFLEDMGRKPTPNHSVDRIDNNGNYEPSNCRWATDVEQNRNRRNNIVLEFGGRRMTVREWECLLGLRGGVLYARLKRGWSPEKTLATKIRPIKPSSHRGALIEFGGRALTLSQWSAQSGISYQTLAYRFNHGFPTEKLFNTAKK